MTYEQEMQELQEELSMDASKKLSFLKTSDTLHLKYYKQYREMMKALSRLIVNKFLTDYEFNIILKIIDDAALEIMGNRNDDLILLIFNEFECYMYKYTEYANEHQLYEVIVNFEKFTALYYA